MEPLIPDPPKQPMTVDEFEILLRAFTGSVLCCEPMTNGSLITKERLREFLGQDMDEVLDAYKLALNTKN